MSAVKLPLAMLLGLAALLASASCTQRKPSSPPAVTTAPVWQDINAQQFLFVSSLSLLPADVQRSISTQSGGMADRDEPYSSGCLIEPGLPRRRFALAAVSPAYAVVHFEAGGFAPSHNVMIFARTPGITEAKLIRSQYRVGELKTPTALLAALRSDELWGAPHRPAAPLY